MAPPTAGAWARKPSCRVRTGTRAARAQQLMPAGALNVWPATVRRRVFQGDFTQYHVDWSGSLS